MRGRRRRGPNSLGAEHPTAPSSGISVTSRGYTLLGLTAPKHTFLASGAVSLRCPCTLGWPIPCPAPSPPNAHPPAGPYVMFAYDN